MMSENSMKPSGEKFFARAEMYDAGIQWSARVAREVPVLTDALGPPGSGGVLDAGCGPGHQSVAMAKLGYRMTALDGDADMLALAGRHADEAGVSLRVVQARYSDIPSVVDGAFDGAYCLGNALAAAGDRASCREALQNLGGVLRPGGRLFVQVVNFRRMRAMDPCVRGPRVAVRDGTECVSVRHFSFETDVCRVTNISMWKDGDRWKMTTRAGRLYPVEQNEIRPWCAEVGLKLVGEYGGYDRSPFDESSSPDLIFVAERTER